MSYAELDITSNFTFLTGASHPPELVAKASELGLRAVAMTDTNTFAGIVRAHAAAKEIGMRYIVGVRLALQDGPDILVYPQNPESLRQSLPSSDIGQTPHHKRTMRASP